MLKSPAAGLRYAISPSLQLRVRFHVGSVTAINPIIIPHILAADTCETGQGVGEVRSRDSGETDKDVSTCGTSGGCEASMGV